MTDEAARQPMDEVITTSPACRIMALDDCRSVAGVAPVLTTED